MSDNTDRVPYTNDMAQMMAIKNVRNQMRAEGSDTCHYCGEDIPTARRLAAPWAETCVSCQGILEHRLRAR